MTHQADIQTKGRAKRTVKAIVADVVIVLLVACLVAVVVARLAGVRAFDVQTGSMEPDMPQGSLVITTPVSFDEVQVGDIVTFVMNENLDVATHRVVAIDREAGTVTTKGDANANTDGEQRWENVVGRVVLILPGLGGAATWITSPRGRIIAITVIVVIGLVCALVHKLSKPRPTGAHVAGKHVRKGGDGA